MREEHFDKIGVKRFHTIYVPHIYLLSKAKYGVRLSDLFENHVPRPVREDIFHSPKDFGYRTDNPSREACLRKRETVEKQSQEEGGSYSQGLSAKMCTGWPTANMGIWKPMYVPVRNLLHLDGVNNEHHYRKEGDSKFDSLARSVSEKGWLDEHPVMIRVNHNGLAYVVEGNTRIRIAAENGINYIRAQFEWMNGVEEEEGPWSPQTVAEISVVQPPLTEAVNDPWKFYGYETDDFAPRLMTEPRVLYRSVSLYELEDIFLTGKIKGGANKFNDFEHRRWVFFADEINEQLIRQGEEIERQAVHALSHHPLHSEHLRIQEDIEELAKSITARFIDLGIEFDEASLDAFYSGNDIYTMRDLALSNFSIPASERTRFRQEFDELFGLISSISKMRKNYREVLRAKSSELRQAHSNFYATSAIIVTKPVKGGLHYSKEFGKSGFQTSEYGFHPNQLTEHDIAEVKFVKDGHIVGTVPPTKAFAIIRKIFGIK